MKRTRLGGIDDARAQLGQEIGVSDWLPIGQARIDAFAEVTDDRQWIHVDPERARRESPFGATIAHGYLTLSLLAKFFQDSVDVSAAKMILNYGLNRVRFVAPVKVDSRVRGRFTLKGIEDIAGGAQIVWEATVDIEGGEKPACIAEMVTRWYV